MFGREVSIDSPGVGESAMRVPRRILHVDDDPQITSLVAHLLTRYGFTVAAVHYPCEVIRELPRFQERVVLLDIDMPRMNGLELLKDIKTFDGSIQVVMLTGMVTMTTVLQSLRMGAEACFFKPVADAVPLADALNSCFQKIDRWWVALDELSSRAGWTG